MKKKSSSIRVLFATSEAIPFAKTGGLADVCGTLPRELKELGVDVGLILPEYKGIRQRFDLKPTGIKVSVPVFDDGNQTIKTGEVFYYEEEGLQTFFIRQDQFYLREYLYATPKGDYEDNALRFVFFSRGVMEFLTQGGFNPDIIHCNDWQTALIPVYLKTLYQEHPLLKGIGTVLTIHNLGYQGIFWKWDIKQIGLGWEYFTPEYLEYYGKVNFLKGGIVSADKITTVSPSYAREIQTPEFGQGLEGILKKRAQVLVGILNGIDYSIWNPETDPKIPANYSARDLSGKKICKQELKKKLGLSREDKPLIGCISRLVYQKGLDLICEAMEQIIRAGFQMIILGTGEEEYQKLLAEKGREFPGEVAVRIEFNDELAHQIEAGADIFLMPSRYEPCGLNQLISLKYGTVPVVRAVGGLKDTVEEFNPDNGTGTGFLFQKAEAEDMLDALVRAKKIYQEPDLWQKLMLNGMAKDFSWGRSARTYLKLYQELLGEKAGG